MGNYLGEFEVTLDAKGRFSVPGLLKKQLPETEITFVVNRGLEKCLSLYPTSSWKPVYDKISLLNDFDPKVRQFRRQFFGGASEVELDSANRILLPQVLREYAGLQKDITLVSAVDKFEIWDTETYKKLFDSIESNAFSMLAQEVMGGATAQG